MERKYELVKDKFCYGVNREKFYRIRALTDFGDVKAGDIGGYIQKEENLSHDGNCWVYNDGLVFGDAVVCENGKVKDSAMVYGNAKIRGNARVTGRSIVSDNAIAYGNAYISGFCIISGDAKIFM